MQLKDFIEQFVLPNTLVRLHKPIKGGHQQLFDGPFMEHEILRGNEYLNHTVVGVTDILFTGPGAYPEAVNIVLEVE